MNLPTAALSIGSLGSSLWAQLKDRPDADGAEQQHRPSGLPQPHSQMVGTPSPLETTTGIEGSRHATTNATTALILSRRTPSLRIRFCGRNFS